MVLRAFRLSILVMIVAYLVLWGRQSDHLADDPGLGWHLRAGVLVREGGSVPRVDPFLASPRQSESESVSPRSWVADQWLGDIALDSLYSFGGWPLLYAVTIGIFTITCWGVVLSTAHTTSGSALCAIIATALAWKAAQVHLIIRPVLVSVLLFAVVAARARTWAAEPNRAHTKLLRQGALLCSVFALWANAHPAFVLGLLVIAVLALTHLMRYAGSKERNELVACGRSVALLVASVGATLVNPYGWRIYSSFIELSRSAYLRSINQEWRPLEFGSPEMVLLLTLAVLPLLVTVVGKGYRTRVALFDCLMVALLTYGAFRMVRVVPYAAIVSAPLAASVLARLGGIKLPAVFRATRRFISRLDRLLELPRSPLALTSGMALAGVMLALVGITPRGADTMGPSSEVYPPGMFEAIERDSASGVILASPDYGGSITWRLYPKFRAILDDRNDLVGEGLYRRYFKALKDKVELERLVDDYGVTHLIIATSSPVVGQLSDEQNWIILYQDRSRRVYRVRFH